MEAVKFANWINNNWFIPFGSDGFWKLDKKNLEFQPTIVESKTNVYSTEALYLKFTKGEGEF